MTQSWRSKHPQDTPPTQENRHSTSAKWIIRLENDMQTTKIATPRDNIVSIHPIPLVMTL